MKTNETTNSYSDLVNLIKPERKEPTLESGSKFYIPVNGKDVEFVVLGKDINPNPDEKGHFIDIMSTSLILTNTPWVKYNEKITDELLCYTKSNIFKVLQEQKQYFPKEIQDIIISRKVKFLTSDSSQKKKYEYFDIGDIWIPSIKEVCGEVGYSNDYENNQQYPYFIENKNKQLNGCWWLRSSWNSNNEDIFIIGNNGDWYCGFAGDYLNAPICLRLRL